MSPDSVLERYVWLGRRLRSRAGRNSTAFTRARTDPTAMPANLNGRQSNQTTGNRSNARIATGQLNVNNRHQIRNTSKKFMST
jgi:hypothetical protein